MPPLIEIKNVSKTYRQGGSDLEVLSDLDFSMESGTTGAIVGQSGSGKSTLLTLMAGLDSPTKGQVSIDSTMISSLKENELAGWRGKNLGFIFQQFQLIPYLNALENIHLPFELLDKNYVRSKWGKNTFDLAKAILARVGLKDRETHYPHQLSGGEQQRVAIARALVTEPKLILADEPSGNLDPLTANSVIDLLFQLVSKSGSTMVLVTHNFELAGACDVKYRLSSGVLKKWESGVQHETSSFSTTNPL